MVKRQLLMAVLLLALQLGLHRVQAGRNPHLDHDLVPGWLGSDYQSPDFTPDSLPARARRMRVLHEEARIYLFEGFLTPAECDKIIAMATPRLERSVVVNNKDSDAKNGTTLVPSKIRTSYGMFFQRGENEIVQEVEERIAAWTLLPVHNGEGLQVLRYQNGQKYEPHFDYFHHKAGINNGGNRYATVLTYLGNVEEGGETYFPFIPAPEGQDKSYSECAHKYLAYRPKKGDALLFHSIRPNGAFEKRSMHGSCPVIKGTKWSMAKWLHVGRYAIGNEPWGAITQMENPIPKPPIDCPDHHENCDGWSLAGECYKNHEWMVGNATHPGNCLGSCIRCDIWKAHQDLLKQGGGAGQQQRQQQQQQQHSTAVATSK